MRRQCPVLRAFPMRSEMPGSTLFLEFFAFGAAVRGVFIRTICHYSKPGFKFRTTRLISLIGCFYSVWAFSSRVLNSPDSNTFVILLPNPVRKKPWRNPWCGPDGFNHDKLKYTMRFSWILNSWCVQWCCIRLSTSYASCAIRIVITNSTL